MALSAATSHLLWAYDSFTNFDGGPDLPWVLDVYENLSDADACTMIRSLCFAWAAGQCAAGAFCGTVEELAGALYEALPGWDDSLPDAAKTVWLRHLGVSAVNPSSEPRSAEPAPIDRQMSRWHNLDTADRRAIEDMASYFDIGLSETVLLYRLGQALKRATPSPTAPLRLEFVPAHTIAETL